MITGIELLTIAQLLSPVIEVRRRHRYFYRRHHRVRVAPWYENVPGSPGIIVLSTTVTTGLDTFRARWSALDEYASTLELRLHMVERAKP